MENEIGIPCLKKRRHSEKRHKGNESTPELPTADKKPETSQKKQNSEESKQDHQPILKHKSLKSSKKHRSADNSVIPNEESNDQSVLDQSIPTIHQIVARVGQLESHMAVLTNSVAELQRTQSKMFKQIKTIKKQWNIVREAWTGQSNLNKKAAFNKEEKSKKKKKPKKGKCKKDKKKDKPLNSKCSPVAIESSDISLSVTPPPDISDNSSSSCSEHDLSNRIRAVLANIMYETSMPKKQK